MIQVDGLGIAYQGRTLFLDAKFVLQKGEKLGFIGRNGSGKSTLFRLIAEEERPDSGSIAIAKYYVIGVLEQHIRFKQDETLINEAAKALRPEEKDALYKAETILFGLGFTENDLDKPIGSFSGGYQLRLHLAKVLISEPDCLLLDEPTNYLDIGSIRWFTRFLQQWKGEFILISHDREFMDAVTTHTIGIHREKIRKVKGSSIDFYEQIMQEETVHEKTRINLEKKRGQAQAFIERFGAKASKAAQAESRRKMLGRIPVLEKLKELCHLDFSFHQAPFPGKKMLEAHKVAFSYDQRKLIHGFSIEIEKKDRVGIIGSNGKGKSTLLRLLASEMMPAEGWVKHSENLAIGYFGQTNIDRLHSGHTIEEEISTSNRKLNRTEVKSICGLMMFSQDQSEKRISVLSGGERSRVLLGKILAKPCNILLLDEPTHHLDMESIEALIDALEEFDGALIIVTHSELILKRLQLNKIIVCHEGRQEVFLGNYEEFLEKDGWHDKEAVKPSAKQSAIKAPSPKPNKSMQTLEREIAKTEERVKELERAQKKIQEELAEALQKKDGERSREHSKLLKEKQHQIDALQNTLQLLYEEI